MYVKQVGGGPAVSFFQMEPDTYHDIWNNYLSYKPELTDAVLRSIGAHDKPDATRLIWDLRFSAIMCRIHYRRVPKALPDADDVWQLADYWKKYFNTVFGKGTEQEFVDNYRLVS